MYYVHILLKTNNFNKIHLANINMSAKIKSIKTTQFNSKRNLSKVIHIYSSGHDISTIL